MLVLCFCVCVCVCNGLEAYFFKLWFSNIFFSALLLFFQFFFNIFRISFQTILFWYKVVFFIYDFPYYVFHPSQYFFVFACMGKPSLNILHQFWIFMEPFERERERERASYNQFMLYSMTLKWQSVFLTIEFNKNKWLKKGCNSSKVIPNITWIFLSPYIYGWVQVTPSITLSNVTSPNNLL